MATELNNQDQPQESYELQMLAADATSIANELNRIESITVSVMPESMFVQIFLPMFAGDPKEAQHPHASMNSWASYAGNVYKEVKIIDDRTGEELYRVPPLAAVPHIDYTRDRRTGPSMLKVIDQAEQLKYRSPAQANSYIRESLTALIEKDYEITDVMNYLNRWNAILTRYGRPGLPLTVQAENKPATEQRGGDDQENWELA